jgi:hypothetical protein
MDRPLTALIRQVNAMYKATGSESLPAELLFPMLARKAWNLYLEFADPESRIWQGDECKVSVRIVRGFYKLLLNCNFALCNVTESLSKQGNIAMTLWSC